MGFAHHSVYALYLEEARTETLRKRGISYKKMEESGVIMPVKSMQFQFFAAARYDDLITIEIEWKYERNLIVIFQYEIKNEEDKLLCKASTELFFAKKDTLRPIRIPKEIIALMP